MSTTTDDIAAGIRVLDEVVRIAATYLTDMMVPTDGDLVDVIKGCTPVILLPEDEAALRRALELSRT